MEKETIKKITQRDLLNSFHNRWLEKKIAAELDLDFNKSSSIILTDNLTGDLDKQRTQRKRLETIIEQADKYLKIVDDKLKEL